MHPKVPDLDGYNEGRLAKWILLVARADGLGAAVGLVTGRHERWAASRDPKRLLNIPEGLAVRDTICIGYAADRVLQTSNPPGRRPLDQLVHRERH